MRALAGDAGLRKRLEADSGAVFNEYGLSSLVEDAGDFQVTVAESEVHGFAGNTPHTDYVGPPGGPNHLHWQFPGGPHSDMTHYYYSSAMTAGMGISIVPRFGGRCRKSSRRPWTDYGTPVLRGGRRQIHDLHDGARDADCYGDLRAFGVGRIPGASLWGQW